MKITGIRHSRHRLRLDPPFPPAWDSRPRHAFETDIVRIETDEGLTGVGSGDTMPGFAGHEELFIGRDPRDLERHARVIDNLSFHYGRCWPFEVALWDLFGKVSEQPVWRLLGGATGGRLRCYASTGVLRGKMDTVATAAAIKGAGYPALKLRFHRPHWREDLKMVEAVRDALGDAIDIMVDCNQAWRMPWDTAEPWTLKEALACARELEDLDVFWLEEPLHRGDFDGMARLRDSVDLRIAGGEMAREIHDVHQLTDRGCLDVLQPDAVVCSGIGGLSRAFKAARDRGLEISPHTWGNGIGLLANAHLAAGVGGCPYLEFPFDPPEWTPERRDFPLTAPVEVDSDGWLQLPETPGLGIELDGDRLAATEVT
ncbi:mandelate racemase/muconate lactonizing enzyme family protein [Ferruginivarius sediminum]|uniref:Mandelate racemase/muconate lactonizing enzyme family protein n=1 Tax=Ferruginivarius sediminum TaxID=2661937 RepID=A0A369TET8_9PROT|nr:mandelate racemase/muconate lactonizing enzyme family protein [Ferruginivarius sediminum]RDD63770.1 mandelate racemase/muconate lactonizing enzyme family protein [Ferruginivarius sediminum]